MSQEEYNAWKAEMKALENQLVFEPENLDIAIKFWEKLEGPKDFNYKSGNQAISIFKKAAQASNNGVVQLARAFRELVDTTGESPNKEDFDEGLRLAIERAYDELKGLDKDLVIWLYESVS